MKNHGNDPSLEGETRAMLIELLRRDRERSLSAPLTEEERRSVLYLCEKVPLAGRYNPDRIPEGPLPEKKMKLLLDRAADKIFDTWLSSRQ